jgi:transcriptional regulator with XRE-family HTH domain
MLEIRSLKTLADRCRWARTRKNILPEDLAKEAGISPSVIWNTECGRNKTIRKITAVASVLEVDAVWLAEGKGSPFLSEPEPARSEIAEDDAELKMVLGWLSAWRSADAPTRSLIESAFAVAEKQRQQQVLRA